MMRVENLYPIKFVPILQEKIWGGEKLTSQFNKKSSAQKIGESWELSGVENCISVVANGEFKGLTLVDLIQQFTSSFVGRKIYKQFGTEFPLLFKFIDAKEDLSIQLHPNDALAKKRHNSFGKTEMWYVMDADPDSKLYAGFVCNLNKDLYIKALDNGELVELIHEDHATKGDAFFIEVGTIHAIGKGILIAEIQQTSDITYRVFDWNRTDREGVARELHTELALDALDFSKIGSCKLAYENDLQTPNQIYSGTYFTTNKINLDTSHWVRDVSEIDSFVVYMCVNGEGVISINGNKEMVQKGETVLVPAMCKKIEISTLGTFEALEVYI